MKVLLLMPESIYDSWPISSDIIGRVVGFPASTFPQLAGSIPGHDIRVYDGLVQRTTTAHYVNLLRWADVIGINAVSSLGTLNTLVSIRLAKKVNPNVRIVLGGHHATFYNREWLREGVDFIVRREGERTLPELLEAIDHEAPPRNVKGISFIEDGHLRESPDRPLVRDLDSISLPRWDIMDLRLYNLNLRRRGFTASLETSRGCMHKCSFCCASSMWKSKQRFKSAERVLEELRILNRMGVTQAAIVDDNFGANKERDKMILEGIIREKIDIRFWSFLRTDTILLNPDFIGLAGRAGLKEVVVGFETMDKALLRNYKKGLKDGFSTSDYSLVREILRKNGIFVCGSFVAGHPQDSHGSSTIPELAYKVCDFLLPIPFLPMKGIHGYGALRKRFKLRNVFSHHRFLPVFEGDKKTNRLWGYIFGINAFFQVFRLLSSRDWVKRRFVHVLGWNLFLGAVGVSREKLLDFLYLLDPRRSPDEKASGLTRKYLSETFISSLVSEEAPRQRGSLHHIS